MRDSRASEVLTEAMFRWRAPCDDADFSALRSRIDPSLRSYLLNLPQGPTLTAAAEQRLGSRIQLEQCPESFERLFRANILLVVAIARNFAGRGLCQPDLVDSGKVGFVYGVGSFDPLTGLRFSSVGGWWIKQAIRLAIAESARVQVTAD